MWSHYRHLYQRLGLGLAVASQILYHSPVQAGPIVSTTKFSSGRLSVQTVQGSSCSSTGADRSSLNFGTGYDEVNGTSVGMGISIPFGGPSLGNCSTLLSFEEAQNKLALAMTLYEAGGLSTTELQEIVSSVKSVLK